VSSGAGAIFGATGGVMEAALRTVAHILDAEHEDTLNFSALRGVAKDIKEATITINGIPVNVAIVHGASNLPAVSSHTSCS